MTASIDTIRKSGTIEAPEQEAQQRSAKSGGWLVIVYDNDVNTYAEVMTILVIATGCTPEEAHIETWEIDHLGQSVVHQDIEKECRAVAEVIATIGIRVEVSEEL